MSTSIQILRWVAVLPGAILSALLVLFPIHWILMFMYSSVEENELHLLSLISAETLERCLTAGVMPLTIIYMGAYIAPFFKKRVSQIIAVIYSVLFLIAFIFFISSHQLQGWDWLQVAITPLLAGLGIYIGLFEVSKPDFGLSKTDPTNKSFSSDVRYKPSTVYISIEDRLADDPITNPRLSFERRDGKINLKRDGEILRTINDTANGNKRAFRILKCLEVDIELEIESQN